MRWHGEAEKGRPNKWFMGAKFRTQKISQRAKLSIFSLRNVNSLRAELINHFTALKSTICVLKASPFQQASQLKTLKIENASISARYTK